MTSQAASNQSVEPVDPLQQPLLPPTNVENEGQPDDQPQVIVNPSLGARFHKLSSMTGRCLSKASNAIGAESCWPASMEKECSKAARILDAFTRLDEPIPPRAGNSMHPTGITCEAMVQIPPEVLANCSGLAIFNVLRAGGGHGSLAGGSGVVVARRADGTWSPPSAFITTTLGIGFMFGLNMYECVCVLNTQAQVDAFLRPRLSVGSDASIAVGPVGAGGHVEAALGKTTRPMWSYMKSRGLWAGVQVDGTMVVTRSEANAVFYNEGGITAKQILQDDVAWPAGAKPLFDVLKALDSPSRVASQEPCVEPYVDSPQQASGQKEETCTVGISLQMSRSK